MKLTIFLMLIFTMQISASVSMHGQVTLKMQNESIRDVFREIENQSPYRFFYNEAFADLNKRISINVDDKDINSTMDELLLMSDMAYKVLDNNLVVIAPRKELQQHVVTGRVTDATTGEPLPGASIVIQGTTIGTVSNIDGEYSLAIPEPETVLIFSYVGYLPRHIAVEDQRTIDVSLAPDFARLDEVVVVGYGVQQRASITGSISSVTGEQLTVAPVSQASQTLAGRLPGLISYQREGRPGADQAALSIRGFGNALVIVDGVEADLNRLDPSSIESVSILKDGAASIYGARAGDGVILVTTKRGTTDRPVFTLNTTFSGQGVTAMADKINSGQYTELEREYHIQSGRPVETAPYTLEDIQKFYSGTDPNYVNTDWRKELIRDWAPMQQYDLSVRGGTDMVKYYGMVSLMDQETMWKTSGGTYKRYNLQSNVDVKLSDNLDLQLDLAGILQDSNYPNRGQDPSISNIWQDYWSNLTPTYRARFPDPTRQPYVGLHASIWQLLDIETGGYNRSQQQRVAGTIRLNYRLPIEGLSASGFFNYRKDDNFNGAFFKGADTWNWDRASDTYTLAASNRGQTSVSRSYLFIRNLTGQVSLNYDRIFGDHRIAALALYEMIDYRNDNFSANRIGYDTNAIDQLFAGSQQTNNGSASEMGRASIIGRLNYSYKDKYLFESIIRADASARFPSDKRWGYFPSVSLGWIISEESFMDNLGMLDFLKIRASYGQSGNDAVGIFAYLSGYGYKHPNVGSWLFGNEQQYLGIFSTGLENPNLTWEEISIYNAGFDFALWQRKLYGEFDVFYRERSGIPATRLASLPSTFGSDLPPENLNSQNNQGFELKISTRNNFGDLNYDITGILSWSRAKWMHYEEADYEDPDQKRIEQRSGQWTDRYFGYLSDGLFTSQEEINNLEFDQDQQGNITLRPGDVRYIDVNGDGVLNWRDKVEIGNGSQPNWMIGFNINLAYRNFDLHSLFQGALGYYKMVNLTRGNQGRMWTEAYYNLRWTTENNDRNALVPRHGGSLLNQSDSDLFYKKADYLRLKSVSIGYTLPPEWTSRINMSSFRIYAAGTNLLTFSQIMKKYDIDPEAPSNMGVAYYPQQRTITLGVTVKF